MNDVILLYLLKNVNNFKFFFTLTIFLLAKKATNRK